MENTKFTINFPPRRDNNFEEWLFKHGYFYIKTKDNKPCFKSKLTQNLHTKFQKENKRSKVSQVYGRDCIKISNKMSSFKCN